MIEDSSIGLHPIALGFASLDFGVAKSNNSAFYRPCRLSIMNAPPMPPGYGRGFPQGAQRSPATPRRGPQAPGSFNVPCVTYRFWRVEKSMLNCV